MKLALSFAIALFSYLSTACQTDKKQDVVYKANGDQLKGSVIEITDSDIRFKYTGEEVVYTFKKGEVKKITFASGRTETFNPSSSATSIPSTPVKDTITANTATKSPSSADRRNKVAILPFSYIRDGQMLPQQVGDEVQDECFNRLNEHTGTYTIVSPRTTNVILAKAGIDKSNIAKYTMTEICEMLGVEYVVDGMINQNNTSQTSTGNKSYDFKKEAGKSNSDKISGSSSYSSSVSQDFDTFTTINIYNDKSENIYSQRRKALFSTIGAYKNTISYLLKRSPLYTK